MKKKDWQVFDCIWFGIESIILLNAKEFYFPEKKCDVIGKFKDITALPRYVVSDSLNQRGS